MSNTHINVSLFDSEVSADWAAHIDKVILRVASSTAASFTWQQTVEEATVLRDQLTAAIARAESTDPCGDCGGRGLFRVIEGAELTRCETCTGEGVVPR